MKPIFKQKLLLSLYGTVAILVVATIVGLLHLNQVITAVVAVVLVYVINNKAKKLTEKKED